MHVKLCRITKLDLGPEMDVAELRDEHVYNNEHESKKIFCLRALPTKLSRMLLLRLKEIRGLSVKMVDVSRVIICFYQN